MQNPAEFVRVSIESGHHSVPAAVAEAAGWKVLKRPATDKNGQPLPPTPRDVIAAATPPEAEGESSADTKEK